MKGRVKGIKEMLKQEKGNLEDYKKTALEYSESDSKYADNWVEHAERAFKQVCVMSKWLGIEAPKEM